MISAVTFLSLSNAWLKVIGQMEQLSSQDEYYLLRSAGRIGSPCTADLHQLLGLKVEVSAYDHSFLASYRTETHEREPIPTNS